MPLSGAGLCDADSITPRSASSACVRCATAGVGRTPRRSTSTPELARPATTAASRNSPEARGSRPTTASGRWPLKAPRSPSTRAAATDRSMTRGRSGRGWRARARRRSRTDEPQFNSRLDRLTSESGRAAARRDAPHGTAGWRHGCDGSYRRSTLAVLRSLTGLLETGLLGLRHPRVAGEEAGLLQRRAVLDVRELQRAGDAEAQRAAWPVVPPPLTRASTSNWPPGPAARTARSRSAGAPCSGSTGPGSGR